MDPTGCAPFGSAAAARDPGQKSRLPTNSPEDNFCVRNYYEVSEMRNRLPAITAVVSLAGILAACGDDGPGSGASVGSPGTPESPRTIEVAMVDVAFEPSAVTVQAGETVRFVFVNDGVVEHEATFGDEDEQLEHAAAMRKAEGMDMDSMGDADHPDETGHADDADHADEADHADDTDHADETGHDGGDGHAGVAAPLVLEPGESGEVTMSFDDPGITSTIIGCHVPGHWEAGMRLDVNVLSA